MKKLLQGNYGLEEADPEGLPSLVQEYLVIWMTRTRFDEMNNLLNQVREPLEKKSDGPLPYNIEHLLRLKALIDEFCERAFNQEAEF